MRLIDEMSLAALDGSRPADTWTVWALRGGKLMVPEPLKVLAWSGTDQASDSVKINQALSFTIADPDGALGAWKFDDPLSVAGTKLRLIYNVGGAGSMNFGEFRITDNEPDEMVVWHKIKEYGHDEPDSPVGPHERMVPVVTAVVRLEVEDLTLNVELDRLEAPESPPADATLISEFRRLTGDYFPTVVDEGVVDRPVSRQAIWDMERLDACQDILSRMSARYRMGGDGECHIYAQKPGAPLWRVEPGKSLVSVKRRQSLDGLYNRWVVKGKEAENGQPVTAAAMIELGPLTWGGDHGKVPFFYTSEMIVTYADAINYANELKETFLASLALELVIETTPRPELQAGDRIEVGCPIGDRVAYMPATIANIRRSGSTVPKATTLTVDVSYGDVVNALRRTDWAQHITAGTPPLTWDRMPGTWGTLPELTWDELP